MIEGIVVSRVLTRGVSKVALHASRHLWSLQGVILCDACPETSQVANLPQS